MTALQQALAATTAETEAKRKRLDTLRAELALRGYELHNTAGATFIVRRWGLTKQLDDIGDVERFAHMVGAA